MGDNTKTTTLTIPTASGLELTADFTMPTILATGDRVKLPFVILLHGNTGWRNEEHLVSLAGALAEDGVASVRFDAPGSGESQGTWQDDYRVTNYIAAVEEVFGYVVRNINVDAGRAGIWGHSMGGLVALYAAKQHPELFKAVCGSEPSSGGVPKAFGPGVGKWREQGGAEIETEIFGKVWLPAEFFIDRLQYNSMKAIKDLHRPLLLIAGTEDRVVKSASVKSMFEVANDPKRYLEYPTDHMYKYDTAVLPKINQATVDFFREFLIG